MNSGPLSRRSANEPAASMALPLPAMQCPLCGGPNQCAPACSGSFDTPCWCASAQIDPEAIARLEPGQRGTACLCPRCATGPAPATAKDQPRG